jgi:hypothetical protein
MGNPPHCIGLLHSLTGTMAICALELLSVSGYSGKPRFHETVPAAASASQSFAAE